jgi:hypothetical protein
MKKFSVESIGPKYTEKLVSAESIIVDFLDTRFPVELLYFKGSGRAIQLNAYYAIESHAVSTVPEWGDQSISITTEEDDYLAEDGFKYLVPQQQKIILFK